MTDPKTELSPELREWRRRVFASTYLCYVGYYFCRKPYAIVKADLAEANGWTEAATLGNLDVSYLLAYTVAQFIAGSLGTRYGPRAVLLVGMTITLGANLAFGFTANSGTFMALMAVNGLAQGTGWSCTVGTMGNWFRRSERGTVMGIWATCFQVGGVGANTLAAFMLGRYGYEWAFAAGSIVMLAILGLFVVAQRNRPEDVGLELDVDDVPELREEAPAGRGLGWTNQVIISILIVGAFYFFVKFIRYTVWFWAPYLLKTEYGLEGEDAGYLSTLFDVFGIAGVVAAGFVSDRLAGSRRAIVSFVFIVGMTAGCVLMYTLGQANVTFFAVSLGIVGFMLYGPDALMTGAAAQDLGNPRGATFAAGIINGMGSIGSVVQSLVVSRALDKHEGDVGLVFALLVASSVGALLCMGVVLIRNRRGLSHV